MTPGAAIVGAVRRFSGGLLMAVLAVGVFSPAAGAQTGSPCDPYQSDGSVDCVVVNSPGLLPGQVNSSPGSGGFMGIFVVFLLVGIGVSVWKFLAVRDMGVRRGMSERDASAAALFSDDAVMLGMVLKDEEEPESRRDEPPPPQPPATIELRLERVEELRKDGTISDQEADQRRAEIIAEI